ncbi:DUF6445 family protein [Pelomonas sp. KK5]|uniref:DUF6445 family protein n=1 Tax=Pelomonas sp. KK5 TaxID=1855730 RepID=UPI0018E94248|nr:DUF6445 family protein [Pelomonas sp. KK5]
MPPDIRSVQIGEHQVVFIDDFLQDPQALKDVACASEFTPYARTVERKGYPGLRAPVPAAYSEALTALMDPLIRLNFQVPDELPLRKSACAFSLTTTPPEALGPLQRTPHFDASSPHHMAVLLYLCDDEHGGTAFYRHKATGVQRVTADNRDRFLDSYYAELNARPPKPRYFDDSDEHFEFLGMMPARFNRLVVYRGSLLHSAVVNPALSLSADPRSGRLTVNSFYDF